MPGDISRRTFIQDRHYAAVQAQQGRVLSDADLNEQQEIARHRLGSQTIDVIGPCGVPKGLDSFRIGKTPDGMDLTISPGRMYVEGLQCEIGDEALALSFPGGVSSHEAVVSQVFANSRLLEAGMWVEISATGKTPVVLRLIDFEKATKIVTLSADISAFHSAADPVMRVVETYTTQADYPAPDFVGPSFSPPGFDSVDLADGTYIAYVAAFLREVNYIDDNHIRETALGGPDTATRLQTVRQVRLLHVTPPAGPITCQTSFPEWDALIAGATGKVNARTQPPSGSTTPCEIPPSAGFRSLENQLYRVEIQKSGSIPAGGGQPLPTFKWSRENASVETGIAVNGNTMVADDLGKDSVLGFSGGQWVEIVDNESALKLQPHQLVQIDTIRPATREITTIQTIAQFDKRPGLKLRRWDQTGGTATPDGIVTQRGVWQDLEDGVQVVFLDGSYRAGDYWLVPARTGTGTLDVPPFEIPNNNPIPQRPAGVSRHYCRLALITITGGVIGDIHDCRALFPPLTAIAASDVSFAPQCDTLLPATTVQEALDILCESTRGGCTFVATPGESVQAVFDAIKPGQDAQICFPVGTYQLNATVNVTGKGNLKISGSGVGARVVAPGLEAALVFKNCASVTIRDLYVETGVAGPTQAVNNNAGSALKLLGAVTVVDCPVVELTGLTVTCAAGVTPNATCITINSSPATKPVDPSLINPSLVNPSVRIRGCSLNVGFMQIGMLISTAARVTVEDNDIAVVAKPKSLSFDNLLQQRIFRVALASRLIANAVMGAKLPPGGITNAQVKFGNVTITFQTHPTLKGEWGALLAKNPPPANATAVQVLRKLKETAYLALTSPTLQAASVKFQQWLATARATDVSVASQGIVVGGSMAADVRIANNTLQNVLQGIHIGLSHRGAAPLDIDTAGTVLVDGNTIDVTLRQDAYNKERHGILVGNVNSLGILNNRVRLNRPAGNENIGIEGLVVAGFLGRKILVRQNHLTGFSVAMRFGPHPPFPAVGKSAWLAADNLFESIPVDFTFPPSPNNNPPLTRTGNILFATP